MGDVGVWRKTAKSLLKGRVSRHALARWWKAARQPPIVQAKPISSDIFQKKVLVLVAHPDDEVLFLGGVLSAHATDRWSVWCACNPGLTKPGYGSRVEEFRAVCRHLGIRDYGCLEVEDITGWDPSLGVYEGFYALEQKKTRQHLDQKIKDLILDKAPEAIITHNAFGEYHHPVHIAIHQACLKYAKEFHKTLLCFAANLERPLGPNSFEYELSDQAAKTKSALMDYYQTGSKRAKVQRYPLFSSRREALWLAHEPDFQDDGPLTQGKPELYLLTIRYNAIELNVHADILRQIAQKDGVTIKRVYMTKWAKDEKERKLRELYPHIHDEQIMNEILKNNDCAMINVLILDRVPRRPQEKCHAQSQRALELKRAIRKKYGNVVHVADSEALAVKELSLMTGLTPEEIWKIKDDGTSSSVHECVYQSDTIKLFNTIGDRGETVLWRPEVVADARYEHQEIIEGNGRSPYTGCVIFHAYDRLRERPVTVKSCRKILNGSRSLKEEYSFLKGLDHKNIIKVWDYQEYPDGVRCFSMDQFRMGGRRSRWHPIFLKMTQAQARHFVRALVDALLYLRQRAILHNDVECANMVFNEQTGEPVLVDFGRSIKNRYSKEWLLRQLRPDIKTRSNTWVREMANIGGVYQDEPRHFQFDILSIIEETLDGC